MDAYVLSGVTLLLIFIHAVHVLLRAGVYKSDGRPLIFAVALAIHFCGCRYESSFIPPCERRRLR